MSVKIYGKYEQPYTERLREQIEKENSITYRHHLLARYLFQREKQIEKIIANIEDDDIDLTLVVEQLWEDIKLALMQFTVSMERNDFYSEFFNLEKKWDGHFEG